MKTNWLIIGIILIVVGLALVIVGYQKMQPTTAEQALQFLGELSGQPAPKPDKIEGIMIMILGIVGFGSGMWFIYKSNQ